MPTICKKSGFHHPEAEAIDYDTLKKRADIVFLAMHGAPGENGTLQKVLQKAQHGLQRL